jgi:glycosyltransferase involved in cell wall biosynthesis
MNPGRGRIRVGYVVSRLDPGGAETQMLELAERLPRDEFEVDFICTSEPGLYASRARSAGAGVYSLGLSPRKGASPLAQAAHRLKKIAQFIRLLRRNRYDIIDGWMYPAYDLAALSRPLTHVPVVIAGRRNMSAPDTRYGIVELAVDAFARRFCTMTVANSEVAAARAIEHEHLDPRRVRIIRNGVAPFEPRSLHERNRLRAGWGVPPDVVLIGCVANYRQVKGLDILISAIAEVVKVQPKVKLILVGEGPERAPLQRMIEASGLVPHVVLHGREPEARSLNPAFDIVVLASKSEGLPNALLEGQAAGRPVVATDVGGVREIVLDGVTGVLVPSDDVSAMAGALIRLASDSALRERMGLAGRTHVTTHFGMERFVREFADLYRELSSSRRSN